MAEITPTNGLPAGVWSILYSRNDQGNQCLALFNLACSCVVRSGNFMIRHILINKSLELSSEKATDGGLQAEDWTLNMEICDIINETDEG